MAGFALLLLLADRTPFVGGIASRLPPPPGLGRGLLLLRPIFVVDGGGSGFGVAGTLLAAASFLSCIALRAAVAAAVRFVRLLACSRAAALLSFSLLLLLLPPATTASSPSSASAGSLFFSSAAAAAAATSFVSSWLALPPRRGRDTGNAVAGPSFSFSCCLSLVAAVVVPVVVVVVVAVAAVAPPRLARRDDGGSSAGGCCSSACCERRATFAGGTAAAPEVALLLLVVMALLSSWLLFSGSPLRARFAGVARAEVVVVVVVVVGGSVGFSTSPLPLPCVAEYSLFARRIACTSVSVPFCLVSSVFSWHPKGLRVLFEFVS